MMMKMPTLGMERITKAKARAKSNMKKKMMMKTTTMMVMMREKLNQNDK